MIKFFSRRSPQVTLKSVRSRAKKNNWIPNVLSNQNCARHFLQFAPGCVVCFCWVPWSMVLWMVRGILFGWFDLIAWIKFGFAWNLVQKCLVRFSQMWHVGTRFKIHFQQACNGANQGKVNIGLVLRNVMDSIETLGAGQITTTGSLLASQQIRKRKTAQSTRKPLLYVYKTKIWTNTEQNSKTIIHVFLIQIWLHVPMSWCGETETPKW